MKMDGFLIFVIVIAGVTAVTSQAGHNCPRELIGICVESCSGDASCGEDQACCSNGCGHVCMDTCGPQDPCPGNKVCCHGGCGGHHVCRDPAPVACPKIGCYNPSCVFGYRRDNNGCPTCDCCSSWCDHRCNPCDQGQVCRHADILCVTTPCPQRQCVDVPGTPPGHECSPINCEIACSYGYREDQHGCQICECCDGWCDQSRGCFPCKPNQSCRETNIYCFTTPCPQSVCYDNPPKPPVNNDCPNNGCEATLCLYGSRPRNNGCSPCKCCNGLCDPVCYPCGPGEKCEVVEDCFIFPCRLTRCVPAGQSGP